MGKLKERRRKKSGAEIARDRREENGELLFNEHTFPVWKEEKVLEGDRGDGYTAL